MFDVGVMIGATVLALWFRALRVPILPIVLAVILGPLLEQQALVLFTTSAGIGEVLGRPIADAFFAISLIIVVFSIVRRLKDGRAKPA